MMKALKWSEVLIVSALASVISVLLPLQTYLGNAEIFPFAFIRLLPELLGIFLLFTVGLLLIVMGLKKLDIVLRLRFSTSTFFLSLLTAALVCVYFESGLLSLGLPELNGGPVAELANGKRVCLDAAVWAVVIVGCLIFARRLLAHLHWIALATVVLSVASLIDVASRASSAPCQAPQSSAATSDLNLSYESQPTVVANVKYSPSRNILIFVLDSMPGLASTEVVRTNAALYAQFPGFTAYPNNIGMHDCTKRGVPGLVTGHYFDPKEMSEADYPMTMYGTNSFILAAADRGWNVAFSPDLLPYGATNQRVEKRIARVEKPRFRDNFAFLRQSTEVPFLSLFDTVSFRMSPFCFKAPLLYSRIRHAVKGRHSSEGFWGERTLYPQLASRPLGDDARPFLGFFHSWGVHPPWPASFAVTATEKFVALGKLMEEYRKRGLYDKSLIIVTSDHGLIGAPVSAGYPSPASALLWVKPEGAAGPMSFSPLKTSHARIAPLVRAAFNVPPNSEACATLLHDEHPLYRSEEREGGRDIFKDWRQ